MRLAPSSLLPGRGPTRLLKPSRRRTLALVAALTVLSLTAAACGGGDDGGAGTQTASVEALAAEPAAPASDFMSTRPGAGIAAAAGNPQTVRGENPCAQPGGPADPIMIAYAGANLAELEDIGLESIIVEEPGLVIEAYVNEVNFNGGINGRCIEFANHLWSLADPAGTLAQTCTELPAQQPVFHFTLTLNDVLLECLTLGAQIPTVGLYASTAGATFVRSMARSALFIDDGTLESLLANSLEGALTAGVISTSDRMGLLHGSGPSTGIGVMESEGIIGRFGFTDVSTAQIPPEYGDLGLLLSEKTVRLLEAGLSQAEIEEAEQSLTSLPPEMAALFNQIEEFYIQTAERFRDEGVTAVAATSSWTDLRRFMRAAELIDWTPTWVANDIQPPTVLLANAPARQARNLFLVSSRRAAGDAVPDLDQGCITLRNTALDAAPFSHRRHSDAWTLITSICDYLDVTFAAMTRIDGPITQTAFTEAMTDTHYETGTGNLITFPSRNSSGAERFRVLQADPDCVLNAWGCMRSTTDWLLPASTAG